MKVAVFLGPSLPIAEARAILPGAIFCPPAAQGDLLFAVDHHDAQYLCLIDGTFHQSLSVWHSEVCYLLGRGIHILGASSMGALRAAETHRFGTVGIGRIFEWYRDGTINSDDEVALRHADGESGYRQMSIPLVNIRASLAQAVVEERLSKKAADLVIEVVRKIYYPDRVLGVILSQLSGAGASEDQVSQVERVLTTGYVDLKAADARLILKHVCDIRERRVAAPTPSSIEFLRSTVFENLYNLDRRVQADGVEVTLQEVAEHISLFSADYDQIKRAAIDRRVVIFFARLLGVTVTPEEIESEREVFCKQRGLGSKEHLEKWIRVNAICEADLLSLIADEAICRRVRNWAIGAHGMDRGGKAILDEVRLQGRFPDFVRSAAENSAIGAEFRDRPEYANLRYVDPARLAAFHSARSGVQLAGNALEWASEHGFESVESLKKSLILATICADVRDRVAQQIRQIRRIELDA